MNDAFERYEAPAPSALFDLTGRSFLVLGGSSGIGLGIAAGLGAAGAEVILNGRDPSKLAEAQAWLGGRDVRVHSFARNVTDPGFTDALEAAHAEPLSRLRGVIFSAAAFHLQPFLDYELPKMDEILQLNLQAPMLLARWAASRMREAGGSLLFVSSSAALRAMPNNAVYAATKGALGSLTRTLAVEWARYGIRVNALVPGWVETPLTEFAHAPDARHRERPPAYETIRASIPQRRWGLPRDFAGVGVWLMSDASGYVTGQEVVVDGGLTAK